MELSTYKEILLSFVAIFGVYLVLFNYNKTTNAGYVEGNDRIITFIILFCVVTLGYSFSAVMMKSLK